MTRWWLRYPEANGNNERQLRDLVCTPTGHSLNHGSKDTVVYVGNRCVKMYNESRGKVRACLSLSCALL